MAMEPSSISVLLPQHPQEFRRADPFACERQQMTDEEFVKHLTTLSLQDNGDAHYELFKIFSRGRYGQQPNYKQALEAGLKVRNRPDPIPEILIELPLFVFNIYAHTKPRNDEESEKYLFLALNLSSSSFFHDIFSAEEIINTYSALGHAMQPIDLQAALLNRKGKTSSNELTCTSGPIVATIRSNEVYYSKIEERVKQYVLKMYYDFEVRFAAPTVKNIRLKYLHWINLALEKVCCTEVYPFFMLHQIRALWMD